VLQLYVLSLMRLITREEVLDDSTVQTVLYTYTSDDICNLQTTRYAYTHSIIVQRMQLMFQEDQDNNGTIQTQPINFVRQ
jgi:hypothetical protein